MVITEPTLRNFALFGLFLIFGLWSARTATAQTEPVRRTILQFSGLVVSGEESYGVQGVHLYVPKSGRGTYSNPYGYFSMALAAGDSVVISAVGYKRQYYLLPTDEQGVSVVIYLEEDTLLLPTVELLPFGTEKEFKEAFLALELPEERELANARRNLDEAILSRMFEEMGMSASANHANFMMQQHVRTEARYFQPTIRLLDPFAWARFIESVKRGDLKRKDRRN